MPDYLRSKTGLTNKQIATEGYKMENLDASTRNLIESAGLKKTQNTQLMDIYPIIKQIRQNTALNLLANTSYIKAKTETENQQRLPNTNLINIKLLTELAKQAKDSATIRMLAELTNKYKNEASKSEDSAGIDILGFKFGGYNKHLGDKDVKNMSAEEKTKYLMMQLHKSRAKSYNFPGFQQ
jgi:hypothetical protein